MIVREDIFERISVMYLGIDIPKGLVELPSSDCDFCKSIYLCVDTLSSFVDINAINQSSCKVLINNEKNLDIIA